MFDENSITTLKQNPARPHPGSGPRRSEMNIFQTRGSCGIAKKACETGANQRASSLLMVFHKEVAMKSTMASFVVVVMIGVGLSGVAIAGSGTKLQYRVKKITTVNQTYVKSMDWHQGLDLIAFAKIDPADQYYDVFVMRPDGSGEKCLTCGSPKVPRKHNGNPAWHPTAKYIVFTAENPNAPAKIDRHAIPGSGLACNLWLVGSRGRNALPLTEYPLKPPIRGVIHPQFSHDGKKLFWAERVRKGDSLSGGWVLKIADFVDGPGRPRLARIKTLKPGGKQSCFYESHAFSQDDRKILFCGDLLPGQTVYGMDIYEMDLTSQRLTRLTKTDNDWDEHAHYSPDGTKIAWMSSSGFDIDWDRVPLGKHFDYLSTELWIMDADGSNPMRLTYFNQKGHPHYIGPRTIVSDSAWSPDGTKIVVLIAYRTARGMNSRQVMIEFE